MKHLLRKSAAALVAAFLFISCGKNQAVKTGVILKSCGLAKVV